MTSSTLFQDRDLLGLTRPQVGPVNTSKYIDIKNLQFINR